MHSYRSTVRKFAEINEEKKAAAGFFTLILICLRVFYQISEKVCVFMQLYTAQYIKII